MILVFRSGIQPSQFGIGNVAAFGFTAQGQAPVVTTHSGGAGYVIQHHHPAPHKEIRRILEESRRAIQEAKAQAKREESKRRKKVLEKAARAAAQAVELADPDTYSAELQLLTEHLNAARNAQATAEMIRQATEAQIIARHLRELADDDEAIVLLLQ